MFNKINAFFHRPEVFPVAIILCLIGVNLIISFIIRQYDFLFYIPNQYPFGLSIGPISAALIVGFVTLGLWKFDFLHSSPIFSVLILSGIWSNYAEKIIFHGEVTDYISFVVSYINLADIQIWVGSVALILQVWFFNKSLHLTKQGHVAENNETVR